MKAISRLKVKTSWWWWSAIRCQLGQEGWNLSKLAANFKAKKKCLNNLTRGRVFWGFISSVHQSPLCPQLPVLVLGGDWWLFACEFSVSLGGVVGRRARGVTLWNSLHEECMLQWGCIEEAFYPVWFFFPWIWDEKESIFEDVQNQWLRRLTMERYILFKRNWETVQKTVLLCSMANLCHDP